MIDKGPGNAAIIQNTRDLIAPDGTLVATVDSSTFARKHGGFGGKVTETPAPHGGAAARRRTRPAICRRRPIWRCSTGSTATRTRCMPIRERAKVAGFDRPILHGAASFGIAAHAVLRTVRRLPAGAPRQHRGAVLRPVFPGDTIRTEMWPTARASRSSAGSSGATTSCSATALRC